MVALFDGHVTGLEGRVEGDRLPELGVSGESRGALRAVPKTRVFEHMSRADVFAAIADEHGLQPDVTLVRDQVGTVRQTAETDMALVVREARASGADVWLAGSTLYVHDRRTRAIDALPLAAGKDILTCNARLTALTPTTTRATTEAEAVTRGRREIHPGRVVDLESIGPLHTGRYLVTRATHTFDLQHGYRTRFTAERVT
jgi:phage protein D